jgi:hypothetical protein
MGSGQSWTSFSNTSYGASAVQLASSPTGADIRFLTAAAANTNPTERARITSGGDLLVGTASATYSTAGRGLIELNGSSDSLLALKRNNASIFYIHNYSQGIDVWNTDNTFLRFATNATERVRITAAGDFLVGTTTAGAGAGFDTRLAVEASSRDPAIFKFTGAAGSGYPVIAWHSAATGDNFLVRFATEASITTRGSITYNRTAGLVAYNTTSDYRAKDILGPVQNSGAIIDALKVYKGQMKGATQSRPMLVAHEAQEHAPYAVTGEKDAVNEDGTPKYQQMDVSALVPLLLAEIQSLRARVAQLESK